MFKKTTRWIANHPEAYLGILVIKNASNLSAHPALDSARLDLERELRDQYGSLSKKNLRMDPVLSAYDSFYRVFRKSYHVRLQLESIVYHNKKIFSPSTLVASMFMAELRTGLLTAGHDLESLELPLTADLANGNESFIALGGSLKQIKQGDLYIRDRQGIISSVLDGPDQRSQIQLETEQVIYTTYGPPGINRDQILDQLEILESYLRLFSPEAERIQLEVF